MLDYTKGTIDESNFSKLMPVIGLYIAGATLLCIAAMVKDLVHGIKSKQFWIPARYFSINAASITIIGVAIKLSADLDSPMPSRIDQLGKLATSAFICVVLANVMPSLGKLKKGELLANTIALAILIITSIVNLIIQLKTGVLHSFRIAHIFMIVMMSFLLYLWVGTAMSLPFTKSVLLSMFENLQQQALLESSVDNNESIKESKKIKKYLMKMSILAQSSCPHFVLSRSPVSLNALLGIMPALALFFVLIVTIIHSGKTVGLNTCSGESDYGWSVILMLIIQAIAVVMGSVSLLSRLIYYINIIRKVDVDRTISPARNEESAELEKFWMQRMDISPLDSVFSYIEYRQRWPIVCRVKVMLSQCSYFSQLGSIFIWTETNERLSSDSSNQELDELRPYFVHTAVEKRSITYLVESSSHVTHKYVNAEKRGPKHLIDFIEKNLSHDFGGVWSFENDRVPPLSSSGNPPNCWSLPLLTMTYIATALPNIDRSTKEWLWKCVSAGLVYVKLVEENLNGTKYLANIRAAAHLLWFKLDIIKGNILSGVRLDELAQNHKTPEEVLSSLAKSAENEFSRFSSHKNRSTSENKLIAAYSIMGEAGDHRLRICRAVVAHSMYKICQTILQDCQNVNNLEPSSDDIFNRLCKNIADILGACFTNLRQCILLKCKTSNIEERREDVLRLLKVFGETEKIMEILEEEGRKIPELPDDKLAFIDEWRSYPNPSLDIV